MASETSEVAALARAFDPLSHRSGISRHVFDVPANELQPAVADSVLTHLLRQDDAGCSLTAGPIGIELAQVLA